MGKQIPIIGLAAALLVVSWTGGAAAQEADAAEAEATPDAEADAVAEQLVTGPGMGLDISTGLIGVYVPATLGLIFPKLGERVHLGLRASWSMPAVEVAYYLEEQDEIVAYLPWLVYGGVFINAGSRMLRQLARIYFGAELFVGSTFATREGVIGDNVTIGLAIWGGLEVYARQSFAFFVEVGLAGVFTIDHGEPAELDGVSQHGGTGVFLRAGPRFYFGRDRGAAASP